MLHLQQNTWKNEIENNVNRFLFENFSWLWNIQGFVLFPREGERKKIEKVF